MNCVWGEKVSSLIDGELSAAETHEVEQHLIVCIECQQLRTDFLSFRNQLSSYVASATLFSNDAALAKILGSDVASREVSHPGRKFVFGWSFNLRFVTYAALVVVALLVGVIGYRSIRHQALPQQQAQLPVQRNTPAPGPKPGSSESTAAVTKDKTGPRQVVNKNKVPRRTSEGISIHAPEVAASTKARQPASDNSDTTVPVRSADAETLTAMHFERAELLLRSFRNVRLSDPESTAEVSYEKRRAQQLVYQNMMLRREADSAGDVQVASLLENLEPILIDIANLPDRPENDDIRVIKDRVERKNIVALLQVNSTALARALD